MPSAVMPESRPRSRFGDLKTKMDWERIPTINASRVSLRPVTEKDLDSLYAVFSDPEVMRYSGSFMKDPREVKDFLAEVIEELRRRQCIQWGIARRTDDQIIGHLAFFNLDLAARKAEIGFSLGRAHWGMGYMQEALQAAIGYGFNEMDLRRIEADVDPRNLRSIRLLERLGFQKEGYLRERWVIAGETQDSLFYGLLGREWNSLSNVYEVAPAPPLPKHASSSRSRTVRSRLRRWAAGIMGLFSR
jgi:ribosomal-protein-alanine N-acetyltransferase